MQQIYRVEEEYKAFLKREANEINTKMETMMKLDSNGRNLIRVLTRKGNFKLNIVFKKDEIRPAGLEMSLFMPGLILPSHFL
ncbi:hypothetical protein BDAP_001583 [Binucleata daphniae]